MTERRYDDDEVAAIFARAADARQVGGHPAAPSSGMTLQELQDIGREAGLSPESVARAAATLDRTPERGWSRRLLGLPIGVGRTVELGRTVSDAEWERLVVDLRETFDARGRVTEQGSFRQWTNGNLQALLEPTDSGHRLRLKTLKASARGLIIAGLASLGFGALTAIGIKLFGSGPGDAAPMFATGLALLAAGAIQISSWAAQRRRQMDGIIARLLQRPEAHDG